MTMVLLLLALQAGGRADYSGQWVVNAAESDFGLIPPPPCRGLKVAHREPEVVLEETRPDGSECGLRLRSLHQLYSADYLFYKLPAHF